MYSDARYHIHGGFPHSEICGSKDIDTSPQLIAVYHVLHRLSMPRHPLNALIRLIYTHINFLNVFTLIYILFKRTSLKKIKQDTALNVVLKRRFIGGDGRNRTDDLMLAKHALSQLSYTPK